MYLGVTPCKSPKISTIWEFRNSDDNFKKPFTSIYPNVYTFRLGGHCKKRFTSVDLNIYKFLVPFSIVYIGVIEIQPYGDSHLDKSKKSRVLGFLFSECNFQKPFTSIYRKKAMRSPQRRAHCRATKFLGMCDEGNAQPAAAHAPHSNEIH